MTKIKKYKRREGSIHKHFRFQPTEQLLLDELCEKFGQEEKPANETTIIKMGLNLLYFKTFKDDLD